MKLGNATKLGVPTTEYEIKNGGEAIKVLVAPPSYGFRNFLETKGFVKPEPPEVMVRHNKTIVKLNDGSYQTRPNYLDHDYVQRDFVYNSRVTAIMFVEMMRMEPTFETGAQRPEPKADAEIWRKYGDDLAAELMEFGFMDGDINGVISAGYGILMNEDPSEDNDFLSRSEIVTLIEEMIQESSAS